ncbi:MAG: methyltransferase [Phycisphaerales bacterium JB038]
MLKRKGLGRMKEAWDYESLSAISRSYQRASVLAAAVELDVFSALAAGPATAVEIAQRVSGDVRGTVILLDAMTAIELLRKEGERYQAAPGAAEVLAHNGPGGGLAMAQHHANCMRRWGELARVVRTGQRAERRPSIRDEAGDHESFILAMDNICGPLAPEVIDALEPLDFTHLLDVGGASGTWTAAFLARHPQATATLSDLAKVMPLAQRRIAELGLQDRVTLHAGDSLIDSLPTGADLAWVSAIVHQFSREENRRLFANIHRALEPGGTILVRDVVMEPNRVEPMTGALFAVNMLVNTPAGGTFTFEELRKDLEAGGFGNVYLAHDGAGMNSVVGARKA